MKIIEKKSLLKTKLENFKKIVTSKQFKNASKGIVKSLKDAHNTMDIFK